MNQLPKPWPNIGVSPENFKKPPREYGILPFWFLNGALDPEEMRYQLKEFRDKGMPGIILHARYGLEMPYIGEKYLERIRFAVEEAKKLGLQTWIYDEMNWPSGTADKRVLQERPDLAQRYIECLNFIVRGPWFTYLTGADSRYIDFERSTPVAAFAVSLGGGSHEVGTVIDLTPNLSFENVIPWEAPAGLWRLMYIVEKNADYYIDALNPESTAEFLRVGYEPYAKAVGENMSSQMLGFYTDEPAMHYFVTGGDNPIVPWTKDMFLRFQERNGYNLRPRLPDLFFDVSEDSARVRFDFYTTITEFYSQAYYKQIYDWCDANNVLFTGHLLYEEWLRKLIRVEGNVFKHYRYMHVIGVDHLYPIIGNSDRPDEHVAMKVGSSAAHQMGSPRLLCESFGGIFMDATMQRMKWIADWEYVLGVNLLNPHGFHYTLEGPRKRDWPPSQFYQYPWWSFYGSFSEYMSRLSHLLSGGRHVAKAAVVWPLNTLFANFTPQSYTALGDRIVGDFNTLTDLMLRVHYDFDYLDEDILAGAAIEGGALRVADEDYQVIVLPPMTHMKIETLEHLEKFVNQGGRVLGTIFLPDKAFSPQGLVDISTRIRDLFGVDPSESQRGYTKHTKIDLLECEHPNDGRTAFLRSYALSRSLPMRIQKQLDQPGQPDGSHFVVESKDEASRYYYAPPGKAREDITDEVMAERQAVADALHGALSKLAQPDILIDNPEIFYLHRVKDKQDVYFFINSTHAQQTARVTLQDTRQPMLWDPSTGSEQPIAPLSLEEAGKVTFTLVLPPVGSAFVLPKADHDLLPVIDTNLTVDSLAGGMVKGYGKVDEAYAVVIQNGSPLRLEAITSHAPASITLDGAWEFEAQQDNALVIGRGKAREEQPGEDASRPADQQAGGWLDMDPGAWSFQLPTEPARPYPIAVWYRIPFQAVYIPEKLDLIIDGFAGSECNLRVNGQPVTAQPTRSKIDSQMQAVEITPHAQQGENIIELRLLVTNATDGLLDLIKLAGKFSLEKSGDGDYRIAAPRSAVEPSDWAAQGYPYYSGSAVYRTRFSLPESYQCKRIFIDPKLYDDALEVIVNGQPAGVRLWPPYEVEITDLLRKGENTLELRVANTLVNLLEAVVRPSGLSGAPVLSAYNSFTFQLPGLQ